MADKSPAVLVMRPQARRDIEEIWKYTARQWSVAQADTYTGGINEKLNLLCHHPMMAREFTEFEPPIRIHVHHSHLILYHLLKHQLEVVRVLHFRQNWREIIE